MMNRPPMPVPGQQQQQQHNYMNQQGPQLPQRSPSAMAAPGAGALPPLQRPHSSSQGPIHPTNAYGIYSADQADNVQHGGHPPPPPLGPRPGQVPGPESIIPASYDPEAVRAANLSRAEALSAQQREELFVRRAANAAVSPNQNSPTASSVSSSDMPPMRGATTASFPPHQVPQPPASSSSGYPNGSKGFPMPPQPQQPSPNRFGHPIQPAYPNQPHPMQQQLQPRPPVVKQVKTLFRNFIS